MHVNIVNDRVSMATGDLTVILFEILISEICDSHMLYLCIAYCYCLIVALHLRRRDTQFVSCVI